METKIIKEDDHVNRRKRSTRALGRYTLAIIVIVTLVLAIALSVGLGVGLTRAHHSSSSLSSSTASPSNTSTNTTLSNTTYPNIWSPTAGTRWQIELQNPLTNTSIDVPIYDIDLFNNTVSTITSLHNINRKVICYFSAGSYEDWRPDASNFSHSTDLGKPLDGWPGEWWLQTNSANVRHIMLTRLDMAVAKGCDGVDPDNIDAYDNDNGLGLTEADAVEYVNFLADAAHARNLSLGLKNGGAILDRVLGKMQWGVNEQCVQYDECDVFRPFIEQGKPVFHIEYPDGAPDVSAKVVSDVCGRKQASGFSSVLKTMDLVDWVVECPSSSEQR